MSLVFYYSPMSTAVVTHWILEELGIPHEKVKLDFATDTKKPEFLKINPNGAVPAIVHDGTPIFESAAISIYLGETFGVEKGLFPAAGPERGKAMGWIVWANVTFGGAVGRHQFASAERIPAEQRNAKAAEAARAEVERLFKLLDGVLEGKQWLVGDSFSIVDAHVAAFIAYSGFIGFDTKPHANLEAWRVRATSRPAYGVAMSPG
jgi:glutathione S-transferase